MLSGPRAATERMLQICARVSLTMPVRILDCGNRSNMYAVAKELRSATRDPTAAMQHIRLTRAFTCYQCEILLRNNRWLANTFTLVFDLLATFFDESISRKESDHLYRAALDHLQLLKQNNRILVGITKLNAIPADRTQMVSALREISDSFHLLEEPENTNAMMDRQLSLF